MAESMPTTGLKQRTTYGERWRRRTGWTFAVLTPIGLIARANAGTMGIDLAFTVLGSLIEAPVIGLVLALLPPYLGKRRTRLTKRGKRASIAALVLGGLAVLALVDWTTRLYEYGHLLSGMEASESAMEGWLNARDNVASTVSTSQPRLMLDQLSEACQSSANGVQSTASTIRGIRMLPWHVELSDARAAYLSHSLAWEKHLRACASDVRELLNAAASAEITATFRAAGSAMQAAEPLLTPVGNVKRRQAIFAN